jgi:hypothetical protein
MFNKSNREDKSNIKDISFRRIGSREGGSSSSSRGKGKKEKVRYLEVDRY